MKMILMVLLFSTFTSRAQTLQQRAQEIRYETKAGGITKEKVGSLFEDLAKQFEKLALEHTALNLKLDSILKTYTTPNFKTGVTSPLKTMWRKPDTYHDEYGNEYTYH